MKIFYISNSIIPSRTANSLHAMKMCEAFSDNGHQIILCVPNRVDLEEKTSQSVFDFYNVKKCFGLKKITWLKIKGKYLFFGIFSSLHAKRQGCALVYTRFIPAAYFACLLGIPTILELHYAIKSKAFSGRVLNRYLKNKEFKRLVCISKKLADVMSADYNINSEKIIVAPDAASPVSNTQQKNLLSPINKIHVGYVGHLYKGKGMELITKIAPQFPEGHFHIIGGTEEDVAHWRSKTQDISNITFYGFLPQEEAVSYRLSFDIVLAPYQSEVKTREGLNIAKWMSPLKIFEYMAARKAIVASDLPVLREVLKNKYNAILCDPDSVEEWVKTLKDLSKDTKLRETIANGAYDDFKKHHTWNRRAEKVLASLEI